MHEELSGVWIMAYTTIDDPSAYFHIQLYTGNNLTTQTITNDANSGDFQADWLWIKNRDDVEQHHLMDSNRGANKFLHSNASDDEREGSYNGGHNDINAFGSNGFTITSNGSGDELNFGTRTYVAWQWKANGGTTTSQTGADINSVTQASTTAGFSIVTYTGDGNTSQTVKHGLGGVPEAILMKNRDRSSQWESYFAPVGNSHIMELSTNAAKQDTDNFGNTDPTSTVFTVDSGANNANASGEDIVAYCFRSIQGYSKIGSYKGNGNADGAFVYTGFKPAWVIVKLSSGSGEDWHIFDSKRSTSNVVKERLIANGNAAENANDSILDFLSNGFKFRENNAGWNGSNNTYIYMAFAEQPFVSSEGVPTTAR
jgi:hypothetical protein